jgi:uncharacterized protein (DUF169 family)
MDKGSPVSVLFTGEIGSDSPLLYCEMVRKARNGESGISLGCKGSRKHTKYADEEVVVGIPFEIAGKIEEALGKIPGSLRIFMDHTLKK